MLLQVFLRFVRLRGKRGAAGLLVDIDGRAGLCRPSKGSPVVYDMWSCFVVRHCRWIQKHAGAKQVLHVAASGVHAHAVFG